jgi:hypothetical protein
VSAESPPKKVFNPLKKFVRARKTHSGEIFFHCTKEEEVSRCQIGTVGWMIHFPESAIRQIFLDYLGIVNQDIVKMHHNSLLMRFPPLWIAESGQRTNNTLNKECAIHSSFLWENNVRVIPGSVEKITNIIFS